MENALTLLWFVQLLHLSLFLLHYLNLLDQFARGLDDICHNISEVDMRVSGIWSATEQDEMDGLAEVVFVDNDAVRLATVRLKNERFDYQQTCNGFRSDDLG